MIRNICTALTLCTVIAAGTAAAQVAGTAPGTSSAATDTGTIQEVVVTARRYAEDLQSTPLAVTALSPSTIQVQDVTNLEDLNSFVPNFKIRSEERRVGEECR